MFLANVRMAYKLGLGFALVTFLTLALGAISLWQMRQMNVSTQVIVQQSMPSVSDVSNLRTLWNRFRRAEAGILNVASTQEVEGYAAQISQILMQIQSLEQSYGALKLASQEQELFSQYQAMRDQYLQMHQQFLQMARDKNYEEPQGDVLLGDAVTNFYVGNAEPIFIQLVEHLGKLANLGREYANAAEKAVVQSFEFARSWVIAGMVLSTALAVVLGWLITRAVTVPAKQAMQAARNIAQGDLTYEIAVGAKDEMGQLLQELVSMRTSLAKVVGNVRLGADGVASASEQIAQGNTDLSIRTEEQASALQQTAASMEQMASTVSHNADTAVQANQLAINASSVAQRGGGVVDQVITTMKGIDASSQKIADIIGVIDAIAFQTNILALNAAVEAARAGEQGRGFAVVASEVRALAGRSAQAAKEIKHLISESVSRVSQGTVLVEQAGVTMNEVVASIRQVADLVGEISAASKEQSQGVGQVSEAIAQMDQTTQQNAALVEQSAAAAEGLQRQAKDLVRAVARFKTSDGSASTRLIAATHTGMSGVQQLSHPSSTGHMAFLSSTPLAPSTKKDAEKNVSASSINLAQREKQEDWVDF